MKTLFVLVSILSFLGGCAEPILCNEVFKPGDFVRHKLWTNKKYIVIKKEKYETFGACKVDVRAESGWITSIYVAELELIPSEEH